MIDWTAISKSDFEIIRRIVDRAAVMELQVAGRQTDKMTLLMDIEAAHLACPLKLGELFGADDANFAHDVFGIRTHLDRRDGTIGDGFVPRYARPGGAA